jgi:hypothetical protein
MRMSYYVLFPHSSEHRFKIFLPPMLALCQRRVLRWLGKCVRTSVSGGPLRFNPLPVSGLDGRFHNLFKYFLAAKFKQEKIC